MDTRTCVRCGESRPTDHFTANKSATRGSNVCRPCKRLKDAAYRDANREKVRAIGRQYVAKHKERLSAYGRQHRQSLRDAVLRAYGDACACCGERRREFLTLDHIAGGGRQHKRATSSHIYRDLRNRGFPPGFRVLCWNCNCSRGSYGYCPHEEGC